MMFVLDTHVVSELRKVRLGKAHTNVMAWTESVDAADLFVSHPHERGEDQSMRDSCVR